MQCGWIRRKITEVSVLRLLREVGLAACEVALFRRHQRMCDGMYGERDAILHSDLAHQFCYVGFYRSFFNS